MKMYFCIETDFRINKYPLFFIFLHVYVLLFIYIIDL